MPRTGRPKVLETPKSHVTVIVERELFRRLGAFREAYGVPAAHVVDRAVKAWLDEMEPKYKDLMGRRDEK